MAASVPDDIWEGCSADTGFKATTKPLELPDVDFYEALIERNSLA